MILGTSFNIKKSVLKSTHDRIVFFRQGHRELGKSQESRNADSRPSLRMREKSWHKNSNCCWSDKEITFNRLLKTKKGRNEIFEIIAQLFNGLKRAGLEVWGAEGSLFWADLFCRRRNRWKRRASGNIKRAGEDGWSWTGVEQPTFAAGQWHRLLWWRSVHILKIS